MNNIKFPFLVSNLSCGVRAFGITNAIKLNMSAYDEFFNLCGSKNRIEIERMFLKIE